MTSGLMVSCCERVLKTWPGVAHDGRLTLPPDSSEESVCISGRVMSVGEVSLIACTVCMFRIGAKGVLMLGPSCAGSRMFS